MLSQEINQQKTMSTVFPVIFLGVAAFLLNVVLSRQIATQRGEIAALKAMAIPTPRSPRTTSNCCCC
jgi:putative ABC transport system permease protein